MTLTIYCNFITIAYILYFVIIFELLQNSFTAAVHYFANIGLEQKLKRSDVEQVVRRREDTRMYCVLYTILSETRKA